MEGENFINTNRLEAFYDAIIAIIVTVLVLELPQPATSSLAALLAIKTSYFSYLISFLVCTNLWLYHHLIYNHVEKINTKIIWQNIVVLLIVSLIPYLTVFVANNPFSLLAQGLYGLDFILMNVFLYFMAKSLIDANSDKQELEEVLDVKNALIIPLILFTIGLVIAFSGYPMAISICCLITIIRSIFYSLK
ncbi:TMEM175 family protein [Methanobrevibacter sp.]|uniref:TMEM175 family protein n=1 Tax=Methanobrevibacter sp. TaxID=66852 RepID=UPI0025DEBB54|nr:TMEM175 family protein [Methanobrevibacter sp.]MBQ2666825.1 DUF1211 domain-containing protein [Methanobrevibacter sp.]